MYDINYGSTDQIKLQIPRWFTILKQEKQTLLASNVSISFLYHYQSKQPI